MLDTSIYHASKDLLGSRGATPWKVQWFLRFVVSGYGEGRSWTPLSFLSTMCMPLYVIICTVVRACIHGSEL
jgi:hypothetical protein